MRTISGLSRCTCWTRRNRWQVCELLNTSLLCSHFHCPLIWFNCSSGCSCSTGADSCETLPASAAFGNGSATATSDDDTFHRVSATSRVKLLEIAMVVALVVESGGSHTSRKTQQKSHSLPHSIHSQQETTHLTLSSWNQFQPNHVSPSALSCTHAAQVAIHQSGTMAMLCLLLTHRARNQTDMLNAMHHCQCNCASLVSEQQQSGLHQTQIHSHLQCTPTFSTIAPCAAAVVWTFSLFPFSAIRFLYTKQSFRRYPGLLHS